jgi:Flp pilus assembly protein TadD
LKIDAANDALRRQYADLLVELGRTEQALKQLEMIERSQGESAELLAQKGMTLDLLGRHSAARQALARALELEPSHPVARQGYLLALDQEGLAAEQRGDYERARVICEEQLSLDPKYAPAMAHLAVLAFIRSDEPEARSLIARLTAADPLNPRRYIMAGSIFLAWPTRSSSGRSIWSRASPAITLSATPI